MKKKDDIQRLLDQGVEPRQIADRLNCALSWIYVVRQQRDLPLLRHRLAELEEQVHHLDERVRRLAGEPDDIIERLLTAIPVNSRPSPDK
jgi:hypothetical protein